MWYVYIILTESDTLYTGIALNPDTRFQLHAAGRGAKYLKAHKPVRVVWREQQPTRSAALRREAEIKRMTRKEKDQLISGL